MAVTVSDVIEYLGGEVSWTEDEVASALAAEEAAQGRVCRMPDPVPADLEEALKRRVQRNLAMRQLPLGVPQGDAEATVIPGRDPEVRRLEGPFRRLVVG